jgi:hypothetical protein
MFFSLFPWLEIIIQTCVVIIMIKSMFCHSLQHPPFYKDFPEIKQSKESSYIKSLWFELCSDANILYFQKLKIWNIYKSNAFYSVYCLYLPHLKENMQKKRHLTLKCFQFSVFESIIVLHLNEAQTLDIKFDWIKYV